MTFGVEYCVSTFCARVGCVVVYQSLDQIGDETVITEMLENIGTQIYLRTLAGNTAKFFTKMLPSRHRLVVSEQITMSAQGVRGQSRSLSHEIGDYVTTADLYSLPAGQYPALVYLNDAPRCKPILVDMAEAGVSG